MLLPFAAAGRGKGEVMSGVSIVPEGDDRFDGRPLDRRAPNVGRRDSQHHDEERYVPEESADGHEYDEPGVDESAYSDANDDGEARDQTQDYARLSGPRRRKLDDATQAQDPKCKGRSKSAAGGGEAKGRSKSVAPQDRHPLWAVVQGGILCRRAASAGEGGWRCSLTCINGPTFAGAS